MIDQFFRPLRSVLGIAQQEMERPLAGAEHEILHAVRALHRVAESVEQHVAVIEGLATSIDPLKKSVNDLTATMQELVTLMAPMGKAELGVEHAEQEVKHFLGFRRHKNEAAVQAPPPAPAADSESAGNPAPTGDSES